MKLNCPKCSAVVVNNVGTIENGGVFQCPKCQKLLELTYKLRRKNE